MKQIRFLFYTLALVALMVGSLAWGQTDRVAITGTVSDQSGAVLAGANVTATNADTKAVYTTVTNDSGLYTIPGMPLGVYALEVKHPGFQGYQLTGVSPMAGEILEVNAHLQVGAATETMTVTGGVPLLQTETSSVATTLEETAIRELPNNAYGGRTGATLLLNSAPNVAAGWSWYEGGQSWIEIAGGMQMTNSMFIDGVDATISNQGTSATPGMDALSEMQLQTQVTDALLSQTGGGALLFELKSGTNRFHGSAFEYLQNEDLNANTWSNNQWKTTCAAGAAGASCRAGYARATDRFNDFGFSAGGPIWKNHTFAFGDFEMYKQSNMTVNPTGTTVPDADMLAGNFSEFLNGGNYGINTGNVTTTPGVAGGTPMPNPCAEGTYYQYGQIMNLSTTTPAMGGGGNSCSNPFPGNIITTPISNVSQKINDVFAKWYTPTVARMIGGNYPDMASSSPKYTQRHLDLKFDENFSQKHHLSASMDQMKQTVLEVFGPFNVITGPFASIWSFAENDYSARVIDTYAFTPALTNTLAIGYAVQLNPQLPTNDHAVDTDYGLPASNIFPYIGFGGGTNGAYNVSWIGNSWDLYMNWNVYHYQDTVNWQRGRHSFAFGGEWQAQQLNSANYTGKEGNYQFQSDTGGPTSGLLTPWVGNGFANFEQGDVNYATIAQTQGYDPRQKTLDLFAQDDVKVNARLVLNLGVSVNDTLAGHMANGSWENFDITQSNPTWAPYKGAWEFSQGPGTTFETNNYVKFGPHIGGAYRLKDNLVARASYGIFYVPLSAFSSGGADYYPANQNPLSVGLNLMQTNVAGAWLYNWDGGYPGVTIMPGQTTDTALTFGDGIGGRPMYIAPDMRNLGHTQSYFAGLEYEVAKNVEVGVRYVGNRGANLHDYGHSIDQTWDSNFAQYQAVLLANQGWTTINSPATAAAVSAASGVTVKYPYAGFSGPAFVAMENYPQVGSIGDSMQTVGQFDKWAGVSGYNSFVAEFKVRKSHGLYADWNYVISHQTTTQNGLNNFSNNWGSICQSPTDPSCSDPHSVNYSDQKQLLKGYLTYDLPFGKGRRWGSDSGWADSAIGGWMLGYNGSYGSGTPMGMFSSEQGLPYYYDGQRAFLAGGATLTNMKNSFKHGHVDEINTRDASNFDFSQSDFVTATYANPFGNTPRNWDHWRWNPGVAHENVSILKHFGLPGQCRLEIGAEFYDVFNRHYYNGPDTYVGDSGSNGTFGLVTSVQNTNRIGQLRGRFEW
jgi:hypothetical protein